MFLPTAATPVLTFVESHDVQPTFFWRAHRDRMCMFKLMSYHVSKLSFERKITNNTSQNIKDVLLLGEEEGKQSLSSVGRSVYLLHMPRL